MYACVRVRARKRACMRTRLHVCACVLACACVCVLLCFARVPEPSCLQTIRASARPGRHARGGSGIVREQQQHQHTQTHTSTHTHTHTHTRHTHTRALTHTHTHTRTHIFSVLAVVCGEKVWAQRSIRRVLRARAPVVAHAARRPKTLLVTRIALTAPWRKRRPCCSLPESGKWRL